MSFCYGSQESHIIHSLNENETIESKGTKSKITSYSQTVNDIKTYIYPLI